MKNSSLIKVVIADGHKLFRQVLSDSIDDKYGIIFIDDVENGEQLIQSYSRLKPDIILADIQMPGLSGIEAIKEIKGKDLNVKSLFLSKFDSEEYFYSTLNSGGKGLIGKNCSKGQLINAIRIINNGAFYYNKLLTETEINIFIKDYRQLLEKKKNDSLLSLKKKKINLLTSREKEVFILFGEGLTRNQISEKLFITVDTLDFHKRNIMNKLGAVSFPQFLKFAFEYVFIYLREEIFAEQFYNLEG